MQRLIAPWIAACLIFTLVPSCAKYATPQAKNPPTTAIAAKKPLTGSDSAELPTSATTTPGVGQAEQIPPPTAPPPSTAFEHLSDAQIVGITQVVNACEGGQARIAQERATQTDTKQFAAMMIIHEQEDQQEQAKLDIPIADSPESDHLESDALLTIRKLRSAIGDEFDRVYIDAQVDEQRRALTLIETQLLLDAKDVKLKAYLERIKSKIQMHLQKAEMQQQARRQP